MRAAALAVGACALSALLPAAACFNPSYGNGHLACSPANVCPEGFVCSSGRCWVKGQEPKPSMDGSDLPGDAGPPEDAPLIPDLGHAADGEPTPGPDAEPVPDAPQAPLLSTLSVSDSVFEPAFSPEITSYDVNLPLSVQKVTLTAAPVDVQTVITVDGLTLPANMPSDKRVEPAMSRIEVTARLRENSMVFTTYNLNITRGGISSYVKASRIAMNHHFGRAVAVSQDTLVVGAPDDGSSGTGVGAVQDNDLAPGSGAVYVYVRTQGQWVQQAYIKPPNTTPSMQFGCSVAIAGNTIVVGASGENGGTGGTSPGTGPFNQDAKVSGAAYVYERSNGAWSLQSYVKPTITSAGDQFGTSVAIVGDTIAVGAIGENGQNGDTRKKELYLSGAAYPFFRTGTTWTQQGYLKAPDAKPETEFGASVALSGDTLVVGAPKDDGGGTRTDLSSSAPPAMDSGAAFIFTRNPAGTWTLQTGLKPTNTTPGYPFTFGSRVAIDGDVVAVGAPLESGDIESKQSMDSTVSASGAVYLFRRTGTSWKNTVRYVKASNLGGADHFGAAVALSSTLLVVGAPGEDGSATRPGGLNNDDKRDSGAAYVFNLPTPMATPMLNAYVKAPNSDTDETFGWSVSISGSNIAIGADNESGSTAEVHGPKGLHGAGVVYMHF
jgi:hypothetical protein